jgi:hypothetical protein
MVTLLASFIRRESQVRRWSRELGLLTLQKSASASRKSRRPAVNTDPDRAQGPGFAPHPWGEGWGEGQAGGADVHVAEGIWLEGQGASSPAWGHPEAHSCGWATGRRRWTVL